MADVEDPRALINLFANKNTQCEQLQFIRNEPEEVNIKMFDNGRLNYTWQVASSDGKSSVIIKHFKEFAKALADLPLSLVRSTVEYEGLKYFHRYFSGSCPEPYCKDEELQIICMEDLSKMTPLVELVATERLSIGGMKHLATMLAEIHNQTSRTKVKQEEWDAMQKLFRQEYMNTQDSYFFESVFIPDHSTTCIKDELIPVHEDFKTSDDILRVYKKLQERHAEQECLVHGDCHIGSVFLSRDRAAVIDMEFNQLGQRAKDLSAQIYILVVLHHTKFSRDPNGKQLATGLYNEAVTVFLNTYIKKMDGGESKENGMNLISFLAGLLGVYVVRVCTDELIFKEDNFSYRERAELLKKIKDILLMHEDITSTKQLVECYFP